MAKYNEILTGRHNRFIQKLFGMKGPPPAPQLSGDIQMSHAFFHGAENRRLESWNLWAAAVTVNPGAGNIGAVEVRVPPNTNVLVVIEKVAFSQSQAAAAGQEVDLSTGSGAPNLGTVFSSAPRDTRIPGTSQPTAVAATQSGAAVASDFIIGRAIVLPGTTYDFIVDEDQQVVITPSNTIRLVTTLANAGFAVTIWWRERALEEGEVT